jgi:hypothetical protein
MDGEKTRLLSACRPLVISVAPNVFGSERKRTGYVIGTMKRSETTVNEHWTVKAIFAFALTCLVGAEIALYSGLPLVPPNWRQLIFVFFSNRIGLGGSLLFSLLLSIALLYACSHA